MKFDPKFLDRVIASEQFNSAEGYDSGHVKAHSDKSVPFTGTDGQEYSLQPNGDVSRR